MTQSLHTVLANKTSVPLTVEERLLLVCARVNLTQSHHEQLNSILEQPLQWDQVVQKAQWHKLAGLVYSHLRSPQYSAKVPPEVIEALKGLYRRNVARQLYFRAELRKVLDALQGRGIRVVVLKGAALLETVYADPGLRPMADLDLLVPLEKADEAYALVREMGYTPTVETEIQAQMQADDRQLAALVGIGTPVIVEIHTHLVGKDSPLRFDIDAFWGRAREQYVAGAWVWVLSIEDMIVHLAVNFVKDRRFFSYSALGQLCDIAEVAQSYADRINWSMLVEQVARAGLAGPVFCGLSLSRQLLDAPIPAEVLTGLEPMGFRQRELDRLVRHRVLGTRWVAKDLTSPADRYRWWTLPARMLKRIFLSRRSLAYRYSVPISSRWIYGYYLRRLREAVPIVARSIAKPTRLLEDLAVDRWLHSLHNPSRKGSGGAISDEPAHSGEAGNRAPELRTGGTDGDITHRE